MLRVGLTGGIGSGKSTVAERFRARGVEVIDADAIARELVEPGSPALEEIASSFGDSVLDSRGRLDRERMRSRVFSDPQARRRLEEVLHPRVREELARRAERSAGPYVVLMIPLLVEAGHRDLVNRTLVVDTPERMQLERIGARGLARTDAQAILAAQVSRAERLAAADDVIVNDGDLEHLDHQVGTLDLGYRERAGG